MLDNGSDQSIVTTDLTPAAAKTNRLGELRGTGAAFLSPLFLGLAPVLGKMAFRSGADPFTVAAIRTIFAALILWIAYLLFWRRYLYIYPAGLLGCVVVGTVNGIGSLFYYNGLNYLDASVAQLLNAMYLIFVVILARLSGHPLTQRTLIRTLLALVAITLVTGGYAGKISWLGAGLMIGNAILFAGTYILSQRILYEMPSPTVTLYVLTTMAVVVIMARLVYPLNWLPTKMEAFVPILLLGVTTALARLTLFLSVKKLGSLQTVLFGIFETAVAVVLSLIFLQDQLTGIQWVGVGILLLSLLLIRPSDLIGSANPSPTFHMEGIGFDSVAFAQAFGTRTQPKLTTEELEAIRKMMEAPPRYDDPSA